MAVLALIWLLASLYPLWMIVSATFSSDSTNMSTALVPDDLANGWSKVALTSSLAAYEFTFFEFPGKKFLFGTLMGSMMLPLVLYVVPLYRQVLNMGLADSYLGVALPLMVSPLSVFILMQFMEDLPRSFIEAAQVDGAGHFRIFFLIVVPMFRNG
jgi:multiple sugar transport system permease protein